MTNRRANYVNMVSNLSQVPAEVVAKERKLAQKSPYRQGYHIESESGSLGDPNGLAYFNGAYHVFYQWSPLAFSQPRYWQHGWKHLTSTNLVDWQDLGAGIESDTDLDRYGTYSGSAWPLKDRLFLMYTGNMWTNTESLDDWQRVPYQVGTYLDQDNQITKLEVPLLKGPLPGYTGHFRDPKLFEKDGVYYAVLGIQRANLTGTALLVKSPDLKFWQIVGEVQTGQELGYMWECPDYYELNGRGILQFCPQGLATAGNHYQNIYQNGYLIGELLDLATGNFACGDFQELDLGFDFYAMQTFQKGDRRLLLAWMGLPEIHYPTEKDHYTGCIIFPRELTVKDDHLYQLPVQEIQNLYLSQINLDQEVGQKVELAAGTSNQRDLDLSLDVSQAAALKLRLFADSQDCSALTLIFNRKKQEFIVSRADLPIKIAEEYGLERTCQLDLSQPVSCRILQDTSSAEIFLENGSQVFSMRIFTKSENWHLFAESLGGQSQIRGQIHKLRKGQMQEIKTDSEKSK